MHYILNKNFTEKSRLFEEKAKENDVDSRK